MNTLQQILKCNFLLHASIFLTISGALVTFGCHSTEANLDSPTPTPSAPTPPSAGKIVQSLDSTTFTLTYNENKQVKIGDKTYSFYFDQIKVLFTEGLVDTNLEGVIIRTTNVSLNVDNSTIKLTAIGKLDMKGNRLPATWLQLMNAANYVVGVDDLLVGIRDVYKSPNAPSYLESNLIIDVIVKHKEQP